MSSAYVAKRLRARVAKQARYRCGYCLSAEAVTGLALDIEHLIPRALGGSTLEENLWLACSACNSFKGASGRRPWRSAGLALRRAIRSRSEKRKESGSARARATLTLG